MTTYEDELNATAQPEPGLPYPERFNRSLFDDETIALLTTQRTGVPAVDNPESPVNRHRRDRLTQQIVTLRGHAAQLLDEADALADELESIGGPTEKSIAYRMVNVKPLKPSQMLAQDTKSRTLAPLFDLSSLPAMAKIAIVISLSGAAGWFIVSVLTYIFR